MGEEVALILQPQPLLPAWSIWQASSVVVQTSFLGFEALIPSLYRSPIHSLILP